MATHEHESRDYPKEEAGSPPVPTPPNEIDDYTEDRLRQGLQFADMMLRNKQKRVSPLTGHCLAIYAAAIRAVLEEDFEHDDEKNNLLSTIMMYERDIQTKVFLRGPDGEYQADLIVSLVRLRASELWARYHPYVKRADVEDCAHWYRFYDYWKGVNDSIGHERTFWARKTLRDSTVTDDDVKTTLAIYNACEHMAIDFNNVLQVIARCANRLGYGSILQHVKLGNWHIVSETFARDLRETQSIITSRIAYAVPFFQAIIRTVIDEYFDTEGDYDNFYLWSLKRSSVETCRDMNNAETGNGTATREAEKLQKASEKRVEEILAQNSLPHLKSALTPPSQRTPPVSGQSLKRPLSSTECEERVGRYKRQKQAWNALVGLHQRTSDNLKKYKFEYGSAELPIDFETWDSLTVRHHDNGQRQVVIKEEKEE